MFDWSKGRFIKGDNVAPDITPPIDHVLPGSLVAKIYAAWDESKFGQMLDYGGGVKAITVEILHRAGCDFLRGIHGIGEKRAEAIMMDIENIMKSCGII